MKYIIAYTDGSCNAKNRLGGYGAFLQLKEGPDILCEKFLQKGFSNTTISRMELLAIVKSMQFIKNKKLKSIIVSDSAYVINSISKGWVFRWQNEGFIDRKNSDLWVKFLQEYNKFITTPIFIHTRGHGKGKECYKIGNDIADILADYKQFTEYTKDEEKI